MTNPRYVPADLCSPSERFGLASVAWQNPRAVAAKLGTTVLAADDWIQASALQHEYVRAIRAVLERRGISVPVFADDAGQGYLRTLRLLKGEVVMRLEDVVRAERVLDIDLSGIPRRIRERG